MAFVWKLLLVLCLLGVGEATQQRVDLGDVRTLTLKGGMYTVGRRVAAVPQLNCVGGDGRALAKRRGALPSVVQCQNQGSDGSDAQWACTAELDGDFRLGVTDVACEGYEYPDDPYVLAGSCGLEFTIELTPDGRLLRDQTTSSYGPGIAWVVFLVVCVPVLCGCYDGSGSSSRSSGPGFWTGAAVGSFATSNLRGYRSSGYGSGYGSGGSRSYRSTGFGGTKRR